jgi:predicted Zn finger-like uncharacterized protein
VQANCPSCGQRIAIDDAKVPERAFTVKCPKCQNAVKFPGKGEAPAATAPGPASLATPASTPPAEAAPSAASTAAASSAGMAAASEGIRNEMMAQLHKEMTDGHGGGRILVAIHDRAQAAAVTTPLTRHGFQVDTLDNPDEGARLLEQGVYEVVFTTRTPATPGTESLFDRCTRLSVDARRRIFLVLLGEEYKTGDGTQAFANTADLVLNPRDAARVDALLASTHAERRRLYQVFQDARRRFEASAG